MKGILAVAVALTIFSVAEAEARSATSSVKANAPCVKPHHAKNPNRMQEPTRGDVSPSTGVPGATPRVENFDDVVRGMRVKF
jgi:hypothetical protein